MRLVSFGLCFKNTVFFVLKFYQYVILLFPYLSSQVARKDSISDEGIRFLAKSLAWVMEARNLWIQCIFSDSYLSHFP